MDASGDVIAAVQSGNAEELRELLSRDPALASARDGNRVSAIMHAVYLRRPALLELLLSANPALDIFEASSLGRTDRVAALLNEDASLSQAWSGDGFTPLHLACFFGQEAAVKQLLDRGADAAAPSRNPMKVMPLHSAAAARNLAIVQALLDHRAPVNARQQQGWTALHAAAQNGDGPMVELLLKHGAERSAANDEGVTPAQAAAKSGHAELGALLGSAARA